MPSQCFCLKKKLQVPICKDALNGKFPGHRDANSTVLVTDSPDFVLLFPPLPLSVL